MADTANTVHIAYSLNDGYAEYTLVSMTSVMHNISDGVAVVFHILHSGLSDDNIRLLAGVSGETVSASVVFHDVSAYAADFRRCAFIDSGRISVETYYRFFIPSVLAGYDSKVTKVLYLDGDTVVRADIAELYNTDVRGYSCGAVADDGMFGVALPPARLSRHDVLGTRDYFNAGVLLLNLNHCRTLLSAAKRNVAGLYKRVKAAGLVWAADQDLLNFILSGNVRMLPLKYNFIPGNIVNVRGDLLYAAEYAEGLLNPVVVHYGGAYLRDAYGRVHLPYARDARFYRNMAGLAKRTTKDSLSARVTAAYINAFYRYYRNIAADVVRRTVGVNGDSGSISSLTLRGYDAAIAAAFVYLRTNVLPTVQNSSNPIGGRFAGGAQPPLAVTAARVVRALRL